MFFVFRGTKYDDIGPNHTKENKNNNKNNNKTTKNQHTLFFYFYGPDKELFWSRISKFPMEILEFWLLFGPDKNFLENHPTFNTFRQL